MQAIQIKETGAPEVLQIAELPTPEPGPGEVLIRVTAAGINFADTRQRAGTYFMPLPLPAVPGSEIVGIVEKPGAGVENLKIGTRVAASLFAAGIMTGGYAEYAVAPAKIVVPIPDGVADREAAALLGQGLTAYNLLKKAAAPMGKTVLVHAAAGGIGTILTQLARLSGAAQIIATAGTREKLELTRRLGADVGINYTEPNWIEQVKEATKGTGVDIIFESVGGAIAEQSFAALADFGEMVFYGSLSFDDLTLTRQELMMQLGRHNQKLAGFNSPAALAAEPHLLEQALREMFELVAARKLQIVAGGKYPLAQAAAAHRAIEERRTTGKVILEV